MNSRTLITIALGALIVTVVQMLLGIKYPGFWQGVVFVVVVGLYAAAIWEAR